MSDRPAPWLSVITVVKDDLAGLERTRASLLAQTELSFEHVVVDSSRDPAAARDLLDWPARVESTVTWVEPSGIYPAMNEGVRLARGEYAYFLNAGDTLRGSDVLSRVREATIAAGSPAWLYGEVEIVDTRGRSVITPRWDYEAERRASFARGRFPAHQATFVRRDALLAAGGFDTSFRIVADYAAFLRLSLACDPVYLDLVIATFAEGGLSTQRWRESLREFHRARREILRPTGLQAVRERWETARVAAAMGAYRGLVRRPSS